MKFLKITGLSLLIVVLFTAGFILYSWILTESDIKAHQTRVADIASINPAPLYDAARIKELPEPVRRYFEFALPKHNHPIRLAEITMAGEFRRPLTTGFAPTTAEQTIATGSPAFVFSATTPAAPGIWIRVYDAYADLKMEMKAKILSALTVVDEKETPVLNQISLRRWLIESTVFPSALLPGGPVSWEPVDNLRARAVVRVKDLKASLIATFDPDGRLVKLEAEKDGDLTTPYHGSGEYVLRGDYRLVSGMMIPHTFTIARAAGKKIYPFWKGRITSIKITPGNG